MKIQNRYFLFYMSSIVVIATGFIGRFYFANPSNLLHTMTSGLSSVIGAVLFCYNGYKMFLWTSRARRFKFHFGIDAPPDPTSNYNYWKEYLAKQPIVDLLLESRACNYAEAIAYENLALEMPTKTIAEAEFRVKEIFERAKFVEGRKKYFWQLHNLAWEYGFKVWDSHLGYTSALDRAGKEKRKKQF